ncbi:hypothetical protein SCLCIDRAFT_804853 [Scleroderma citrinum Foug A]|uniref:Uncharacterized protein n=1 Tax=Scleroderma citrinum Foug A TaxID=1036808 RepID=A0A0C3DPF7_9AGAM|nr:hypothetical protein SCLCIDRAFT_804853 [Scleroderma citrinum Foug A]
MIHCFSPLTSSQPLFLKVALMHPSLHFQTEVGAPYKDLQMGHRRPSLPMRPHVIKHLIQENFVTIWACRPSTFPVVPRYVPPNLTSYYVCTLRSLRYLSTHSSPHDLRSVCNESQPAWEETRTRVWRVCDNRSLS